MNPADLLARLDAISGGIYQLADRDRSLFILWKLARAALLASSGQTAIDSEHVRGSIERAVEWVEASASKLPAPQGTRQCTTEDLAQLAVTITQGVSLVNGGPHFPRRTMIVSTDLFDVITETLGAPVRCANPAHATQHDARDPVTRIIRDECRAPDPTPFDVAKPCHECGGPQWFAQRVRRTGEICRLPFHNADQPATE